MSRRSLFPAARLGVAGAFLYTTLALPFVQARALDRRPFAVVHDEYSTSGRDGDYFSPRRLRERNDSLDFMIAGYNARFAAWAGRTPPTEGRDPGATAVSLNLEKFLAAGEMAEQVELKRAELSSALASAGGFQFRSFSDGRREWYKGGHLARVENEKVVDDQGRESRRDTTDMSYDARGRLTSYRVQTREATGALTTSHWTGVYDDGVGAKAKLLSFTEKTWDALGNTTTTERDRITYGADGKRPVSYFEKQTDQYGTVTQREVTGSTYDKDGNLLAYFEKTTLNGDTTTRSWRDAVYEKTKDGTFRLLSYKETLTDAQGRASQVTWEGARYDDKNRLTAYRETTVDAQGRTTARQWEKGTYDSAGRLTDYQETVTGPDGKTTRTWWEGGRYDNLGRLVEYTQATRDAEGVTSRVTRKASEYNALNQLIGYTENSVDGWGRELHTVWRGTAYNAKGHLTSSTQTDTDAQGRATATEWAGAVDEKGRLLGFTQTTTGPAGQVSRLSRQAMAYDAEGRLTSFTEDSTDDFGQASRRTWTATAFDADNRVTEYEETVTDTKGDVTRRRWTHGTYDARGRLTGYDEIITAHGGDTVHLWRALEFDAHGQASRYTDTQTDPLGDTLVHNWTVRYDGKGRMASTADDAVDALGRHTLTLYTALDYDADGRATRYKQTTDGPQGRTERLFRGRYDSRGLLLESEDTTTDGGGLTVTVVMTGAKYDAHGRLTDSVQVTRRSDQPGLATTITVTGQTYDRVGEPIGGVQTTTIKGTDNTGRDWDQTTVSKVVQADLDQSGRALHVRRVSETTGTLDGTAARARETTDTTYTGDGLYIEETRHDVYDGSGAVTESQRTRRHRTATVLDAQGRALTYTETSQNSSAPDLVTTTHARQTYGASGQVMETETDAVDSLGQRTHTLSYGMTYDAAGRLAGATDLQTHPGQDTLTETTHRSAMTYDPTGSLAGQDVDTVSEGPGYYSRRRARQTLHYDGAGHSVLTVEEGERDGAAYRSQTATLAWDAQGRPLQWRETLTGDNGAGDTIKTAAVYDRYGRLDRYHQKGLSNGSFSEHDHMVLTRDAAGRELSARETGQNDGGAFDITMTYDGYNDLGQVTGAHTVGHRAQGGDFEDHTTHIVYDIHGRQQAYDHRQVQEDKEIVSRWTSKGYDDKGRSLGYVDEGQGTDADGAFTWREEKTVASFNAHGQATDYTVATLTAHPGGATQQVTVEFSQGTYDEQGRLDSFYQTTDTLTTDAQGNREHTTNETLRTRTTYYDWESTGTPPAGRLAGWEEFTTANADADNAVHTVVGQITYDAQGLQVDGQTASAQSNRFNDALRQIQDFLAGGPLDQARAARILGHLLDSAQDLAASIGDWIAQLGGAISDTLRATLESLGIHLDAAATSGDLLNEIGLINRIDLAAGGTGDYALPEELKPLAATLGFHGRFDAGFTLVQRKVLATDAQGRATEWEETARSAASPAQAAVTRVHVVYDAKGRLTAYDARTTRGDLVTRTFRDTFTYDSLGRSTYREATFEGDQLTLLDETATSGQTVMDWAHLTWDQKHALLDDVLNEKVEVLGLVEFDVPDHAEYNADGVMIAQYGSHIYRGSVLSDFPEGDLSQQTPAELQAAAVAAIVSEAEAQLAVLQGTSDTQAVVLAQELDDLRQAQAVYDNAKAANDVDNAALTRAEQELDAMQKRIQTLLGQIDGYRGTVLARKEVASATNHPSQRGVSTFIEKKWYAVIRINSNGDLERAYEIVETEVVALPGGSPSRRVIGTRDDMPPRGTRGSGFPGRRYNTVVEVIARAGDEAGLLNSLQWNNANITQWFRDFTNSPALWNGGPLKGLLDILGQVIAGRNERDGRLTNNLKIAREAEAASRGDLTDKGGLLDGAKTSVETAQKTADESKAIYDEAVAGKDQTIADQTKTVLDNIDQETAAMVKNLSSLNLIVNGKSLQLTEEQAKSLLDGAALSLNGVTSTLTGLSTTAKVKTNLNRQENTVRLGLDHPDTASTLTWSGSLTYNGQTVGLGDTAVLKQIAQGLPSPLEGEGGRRPGEGLNGLALSDGGSFSYSANSAQTHDAVGRLTSQTAHTLTLSRSGTETVAKLTTQRTGDYNYNAKGHVTGYKRLIQETGQPDKTETLVNAGYDEKGRQVDTHLSYSSTAGGETDHYEIYTHTTAFDPSGRPAQQTTARVQGGEVSVTESAADARTDAQGHTLFTAVWSWGVSQSDWDRAGGDTSTLAGAPALVVTWNQSWSADGSPLTAQRLTLTGADGSGMIPPGAPYAASLETLQFHYQDGRLTSTTSNVLDYGRDAAGSVLLDAYRRDIETTQFTPTGRVKRQKATEWRNGLPKVNEDYQDREYDSQGHLKATYTRTTDSEGKTSESVWRAVKLDEMGRAVRFERTTTDPLADGSAVTRTETSNDDTRYDANGRVVHQSTRISQRGSDGLTEPPVDEVDDVAAFDVFGRAVSTHHVSTKHLSTGDLTTDEHRQFHYDTQGRLVKTTVDGRDVNGAYQSVQETTAFDPSGRALRTRNAMTRGGLTTVRTSAQDIRYDADGRVTSTRDHVRQTGDGIDKITTDTLTNDQFDSLGRATAYTRVTQDAALVTTDAVTGVTFDQDGRVSGQTTGTTENSADPSNPLYRRTQTVMTGMRYDSRGSLVDWDKTVTDPDTGTLKHLKAVLAEYDASGRATTILELSTDGSSGVSTLTGFVGATVNALGLTLTARTVTVEGTTADLTDRTKVKGLQAALQAGRMEKQGAKTLLTEFGFTAISSQHTQKPNHYDAAGRLDDSLVSNDTVSLNPTGPEDAGTRDVFGGRLDQEKAELEKAGYNVEVTKLPSPLGGCINIPRYRLTYSRQNTETHNPYANVVHLFDSLNRAHLQTTTAKSGSTTMVEQQRLSYTQRGEIAAVHSSVREKGLNGDGTGYDKTYQQEKRFNYDAQGRVSWESTRHVLDSASSLLDTTLTVDNISYNEKGERTAWDETTDSNAAPGKKDLKEVTGAVYNAAHQLVKTDEQYYDLVGATKIWLYTDANVRRVYDDLGRVVKTTSQRTWGAAYAQARAGTGGSGDPGQAGGGVTGLDDGWTAGTAVVTTSYQYYADSNSLMSLRVTANGTGTHTNGLVQAKGIHLDYLQTNMRYDSQGRLTGYRQKVTQIEYHEYSKMVNKGLGKKKRGGARCESVTTVSDVEVLEFDAFGRQVLTRTVSQRSDYNRTYSEDTSRVLAFDSMGRASKTERTSYSRQNLGKGVTAEGGSHVIETPAYDAFGNLNRSATPRTVLSEWSKVTDSSSFAKTMKVVDIVMQAVQVVGTVLAFTPLAPIGRAMMFVASVYNLARSGISLHDLGVGGRDREGAGQRAFNFYTLVGSMILQKFSTKAGATSQTTTAGAQTFRQTVSYMVSNAVVQGGAALASGARAGTTALAGAMGLVSGGTGGGADSNTIARGLVAGAGEAMIQFGGSQGSESTRNLNIVLGSALRGGAGRTEWVQGSALSAGQRLVMNELTKAQGGTGAGEHRSLNRTILLSGLSGVVGVAMGKAVSWVRSFSRARDVVGTRSGASPAVGGGGTKFKDMVGGVWEGIKGPVQTVGEFFADIFKLVRNRLTLGSDSAVDLDRVLTSDGTLGWAPEGARAVVDSPVTISGETWESGTFVRQGRNWILEGEGSVRSTRIGGFAALDGASFVTQVQGGERGALRVVGREELPAGTRVADLGTGLVMVMGGNNRMAFLPRQRVDVVVEGQKVVLSTDEGGRLISGSGFLYEQGGRPIPMEILDLQPDFTAGALGLQLRARLGGTDRLFLENRARPDPTDLILDRVGDPVSLSAIPPTRAMVNVMGDGLSFSSLPGEDGFVTVTSALLPSPEGMGLEVGGLTALYGIGSEIHARGMADIPGLGLRLHGVVTISETGLPEFGHGTLFQNLPDGETYFAYRKNGQPFDLPAEVRGDQFRARFGSYVVRTGPHSHPLAVEGLALTGRITVSGVALDSGWTKGVSLRGEGRFPVHGRGDVYVDAEGVPHFRVLMEGRGLVPGVPPEGGAAPRSPPGLAIPGLSDGVTFDNRIHVLRYDNDRHLAEVQGTFWLLDDAYQAFGAGTSLTLEKGQMIAAWETPRLREELNEVEPRLAVAARKLENDVKYIHRPDAEDRAMESALREELAGLRAYRDNLESTLNFLDSGRWGDAARTKEFALREHGLSRMRRAAHLIRATQASVEDQLRAADKTAGRVDRLRRLIPRAEQALDAVQAGPRNEPPILRTLGRWGRIALIPLTETGQLPREWPGKGFLRWMDRALTRKEILSSARLGDLTLAARGAALAYQVVTAGRDKGDEAFLAAESALIVARHGAAGDGLEQARVNLASLRGDNAPLTPRFALGLREIGRDRAGLIKELLVCARGEKPADPNRLAWVENKLGELETQAQSLGDATGLLAGWRKAQSSLGYALGSKIMGRRLGPQIEETLIRAAEHKGRMATHGEMGHYSEALGLQTELGWGVAAIAGSLPASVYVGATLGTLEFGVSVMGAGGGNWALGTALSKIQTGRWLGTRESLHSFAQGGQLAPVLGLTSKLLGGAQLVKGLGARTADFFVKKGVFTAQAMDAGLFAARLGWRGKLALAGTGMLNAAEQIAVFETLNGPGKKVLAPLMTVVAAELGAQGGGGLTPYQEEEWGGVLATMAAFVSPVKGAALGARSPIKDSGFERGYRQRVALRSEGFVLVGRWGRLWRGGLTAAKDLGLAVGDELARQIGWGGMRRGALSRRESAQRRQQRRHAEMESQMAIQDIPGVYLKLGEPSQKRAAILLTSRGARELGAGGKLETALKRLAAEGYRIEVGALDRAAYGMLKENVALMNALGKKSLLDMAGKTRRERRSALKDLRVAEKADRAARREYAARRGGEYAGVVTALRDGRLRERDLVNVWENKEALGERFVSVVEEKVPSHRWGRAERVAGGLGGGEGGLRQGIQHLRPDGKGPGAGTPEVRHDRKASDKARPGLGELREKGIARERTSEKRARTSEKLSLEIGRVRSENERLVKRRSELRPEVERARGRAEISRRGVESARSRVESFDRWVEKLENRAVKRGEDMRIQDRPQYPIEITPLWEGPGRPVEEILRTWEALDGGLEAAYQKYPFLPAEPAAGAGSEILLRDQLPLLPSWVPREILAGLNPGEVPVFSAYSTRAMAESFLRGVRREKLNHNTRDGKGVYVSPDPFTPQMELLAHDRTGGFYVVWGLKADRAKVADYHELGQDLGVVGGDNYILTDDAAQRARMTGHTLGRRDSARNPAGTVYTVLDDFGMVRPLGVVRAPENIRARARALFDRMGEPRAGPPEKKSYFDRVMNSPRGGVLVPERLETTTPRLPPTDPPPNNELPVNGLFARVMGKKYAYGFLNREKNFAGQPSPELTATDRIFSEGEAFVAAHDDLKGFNTPHGYAERLTLLDAKVGGGLKEGMDTVIVFRAPDGTTVATPVNAELRGYGNTGMGTTLGKAREWVIPNGTRAELESRGFTIEGVYSVDQKGVKTEWNPVVVNGKTNWEPSGLQGLTKSRSSETFNPLRNSSDPRKLEPNSQGINSKTFTDALDVDSFGSKGVKPQDMLTSRFTAKSPPPTPGPGSPGPRSRRETFGNQFLRLAKGPSEVKGLSRVGLSYLNMLVKQGLATLEDSVPLFKVMNKEGAAFLKGVFADPDHMNTATAGTNGKRTVGFQSGPRTATFDPGGNLLRLHEENLFSKPQKDIAFPGAPTRAGPFGTPNFYSRPNGDLVPATGYRYISSNARYLGNLIKTGKIPPNVDGTYISFDKIDNPQLAPRKLQVPHDAAIRVEFDTKQLLEDLRIPYGKWGTAEHLEPLTKDFLDKGPGGATQAITRQEIRAKRIIDIRTGKVLYES
jgi:hypothetical protein